MTAAPGLRCVLVEDQLMFMQLLAGMLSTQEGLHVVATATTAAEGMEACRTYRPDLLILDLSLPDQSGEMVAQTLATVKPEARLIVLSAHASSFVCSPSLRTMLHAVVDKIDAYQRLGSEIAELLRPNLLCQRLRLTAREQEVLNLVGQGLTTNQIAEVLGVTFYTVSTHRKNISLKLRLKGGELVRYAALQALQPQALQPENRASLTR